MQQETDSSMSEKIRKVMAKSLGVVEGSITENTTQEDIYEWDSINHIKMIVAFEREFDITIPDEQVSNMISFRLIESVIQQCYGKSA